MQPWPKAGIIVLDDALNEQWPGVAEGLHRHFARQPNLVPFAIGANKAYFCRPSHRDAYRAAAMAAALDSRMPEFLGEPVAVLHFTRPRLQDRLKDRVAGSPAWRRLRTTPIGLPLRWAWHTGRTLRRGLMRREDF